MLLFTGFGLPDTMQNRAESSFSAESMDYDFRADVVSIPQMATPIEGLGSKSQAIMQMPVMTGPSDGYDRVIPCWTRTIDSTYEPAMAKLWRGMDCG